METRIDELLDTKGVTVAYGHPTPRRPAYEWGVWGGVLLEGGTPIEKVKTRGRPKRSSAA